MKPPHAVSMLRPRGLRPAVAGLALLLALTGAALAEPVFSFDSSPGKLPKTLFPSIMRSS